MRDLLTKTRIGVKDRCDMLDHYMFDLGMRSTATRGDLRFGTLWHKAMEFWWNRLLELQEGGAIPVTPTMIVLQHAIARLRRWAAEEGDINPYDLVKAEELLKGYHLRWQSPPMLVVGVERQFRVPHVNPETGGRSQTFDLAGVVDVIAIDDKGRRIVIEHKTSSQDLSPGSPFWRQLRMSTEGSLYWVAAGEGAGGRIEGCLYDCVRKPTIRPLAATPEDKRQYKKDGTLYASQRARDELPEEWRIRVNEWIAENADSVYQRLEVTRTDKDIQEFLVDLWDVGLQIQRSRSRGVFRRSPGNCQRWNHLCDFFDVCTGVARLDDKALFEAVENKHPEIRKETP